MLKANLQYIVDKYVDNDSEYCINISFKTRKKILSMFAIVNDRVHNVPKYSWISTRNVYGSKSVPRYLSRTGTTSAAYDSPMSDEERSQLDLECELAVTTPKRVIMPRMKAIDNDNIKMGTSQVPTLEWMGNKGNNTLENEKNEKDNQLMIEYLNTFDKALIEVIKLLNGDCLRRFYSTEHYKRLLKQFMSHKENINCTPKIV